MLYAAIDTESSNRCKSDSTFDRLPEHNRILPTILRKCYDD